jgi:hypothetical protein
MSPPDVIHSSIQTGVIVDTGTPRTTTFLPHALTLSVACFCFLKSAALPRNFVCKIKRSSPFVSLNNLISVRLNPLTVGDAFKSFLDIDCALSHELKDPEIHAHIAGAGKFQQDIFKGVLNEFFGLF